MNRFEPGTRVVCINNEFTRIENGRLIEPPIKPALREILNVDEYDPGILRFYKYDHHPEGAWWDARMFRPVDEIAIVSEALEEVQIIELQEA